MSDYLSQVRYLDDLACLNLTKELARSLSPSGVTFLQYYVNGKQFSVKAEADRWQIGEGTHTIELESIPLAFGGSRKYFLCPCCSKRATKLYAVSFYAFPQFKCRSCVGLNYRSQNLTRSNVVLEQLRKVQTKFSGVVGSCLYIGEKPKRMRYKTWRKIQKRYSVQLQKELHHLYTLRGRLFGDPSSRCLIDELIEDAVLSLSDCGASVSSLH